MRDVSFMEICLDHPITAGAMIFEDEINISVYGGDRPHIGAVSIGDAGGKVKTTRFPGHRDDAVSEKWAASMLEYGFSKVVVTVGIHYDNLSTDGIQLVLGVTDCLLKKVFQSTDGFIER